MIDRDCMVCGHAMEYHFSKVFNAYNLETVHYAVCPNCSLGVSDTHLSMTDEAWGDLNHAYHSSFHFSDACEDDPNWLPRMKVQARVIAELQQLGFFEKRHAWVDYACGDGKLADLIRSTGNDIQKFERYMEVGAQDFLTESELSQQKYDLVLNTCVLEHIRDLSPIEEMMGLLSPDGVWAMHTFVGESDTRDPNWFYLLPVHTVFHSNDSMERLFQRWGFTFSIYHLEARMWFCFRKDMEYYSDALAALKQLDGYFVKQGFVDYWRPGFLGHTVGSKEINMVEK